MEVQHKRSSGTQILGRIYESVPGHAVPDKHRVGSVVSYPLGSQMVPGPGRITDYRKGDGEDGHALSENGQGPKHHNNKVTCARPFFMDNRPVSSRNSLNLMFQTLSN